MLIRQKACGANGTGQFDLFLPDLTGLGRFRFRLLVNGNTKRTRLRGLDAPRKRKGDQQPNQGELIMTKACLSVRERCPALFTVLLWPLSRKIKTGNQSKKWK